METFQDVNGNHVQISFQRDFLSEKSEHVLVICSFYGQWLLTKHKIRGLEFPGGKREKGETLEEAAKREVYEETGASLKTIEWIGDYKVTSEKQSFVKTIFYGEVESLEQKEDYFETEGPVLVRGDLLSMRMQDGYSFIMKDKVIEKAINEIHKKTAILAAVHEESIEYL
jgi:8-oxo-dGTP diphosphatase